MKRSQIIQGMAMQNDWLRVLYDRQEDRVVEISEDRESVESLEGRSDTMPEWEKNELELYRAIENDTSHRFIPLPDRFDFDQWEIMSDFATSLQDDRIASRLADALNGRGAFGRFNRAIREEGVAQQWYEFRDARFGEVAQAWAQRHGLTFESDN